MIRPLPHLPEDYLPAGISELTIYPRSGGVTRVLAVDLDEAARTTLQKYVPNVNDYGSAELAALAADAERIGFRGTRNLLTKIREAETRNRRREVAEQQLRDRHAVPLDFPTTVGGGVGMFVILAAFIFLTPPWSFVVMATSVPFAWATWAGAQRTLEREAKQPDHYRKTLRWNAIHFVGLEDSNWRHRPPEYVSFSDIEFEVETVRASLLQLSTAGLQTEPEKTRTIAILDTLIRNKLAAARALEEYTKAGAILEGLSGDVISADAELTEVNSAHKRYRDKNLVSLEAVSRAFTELQTLAGEVATSARETKAKLRATRYVVENDEEQGNEPMP